MANRNLFSTRGKSTKTDTVNVAGGKAYKRSNEAALAQYALTGVFANHFYVSAKFQLDKVLELLNGADDSYVAKLAIYARRDGYMKDMPSFLVAWLAAQKSPHFEVAFRKVIDNGKMLRNFVQYIRSGVLGRKSFGTRIKREVQRWFVNRDAYGILRALPGNEPTLADIVKMVHVKPKNLEQDALYGWLLGKISDGRTKKARRLPELVREFENFKRALLSGETDVDTPDVPFQLLTGLELTDNHWKGIARDAKWMMTRMNLNSFLRHGVFKDKKLTSKIADRLRDAELILKARQFPYQLMAAYKHVDSAVPNNVVEALQDAMEIAIENVPAFPRRVNLVVDVSGSMGAPITGWYGFGHKHGGRESKIRCVDVAGLFAAMIMRRNRDFRVLPVDTSVHAGMRFNPRDSVFTNAEKFRKLGGGGTALGEALRVLNKDRETGDIIVISDNESWADRGVYGHGTSMQSEFEKFRRRDKAAKLVCIDIWASDNTQVKTSANVLNVGGFNDQVFTVADAFFKGDLTGDHLVNQVKQTVEL